MQRVPEDPETGLPFGLLLPFALLCLWGPFQYRKEGYAEDTEENGLINLAFALPKGESWDIIKKTCS